MTMFITVRINTNTVIDATVTNEGPPDGWEMYVDGDGPGGPGVRRYRVNATFNGRHGTNFTVEHPRSDGAAALTATVMNAIVNRMPDWPRN